MSHGLTYEQAAAILGCHFSNVAKLIRKGDLTSTGQRGASLSREQVEALAERRAAEREAMAARSPRRYQRIDLRPDDEHEWLSPRQVAQLLGVTRPAVRSRVHRGTLPARRAPCGQDRGRGDYRIGQDDLEAYVQRTYAETERWIEEHPFAEDERPRPEH